MNWWQGDRAHANLSELVDYLDEIEFSHGWTARDYARLLEKPWKYDEEYQQMRADQEEAQCNARKVGEP